jgi:hypothetical protein
VEFLGQRDEQVRLGVVVVVEGRDRPAGRRGDVADLGVEVAVAGEDEPGRLAEGLVGLAALAGGLFGAGGTGRADRRHETRTWIRDSKG